MEEDRPIICYWRGCSCGKSIQRTRSKVKVSVAIVCRGKRGEVCREADILIVDDDPVMAGGIRYATGKGPPGAVEDTGMTRTTMVIE
jgi:hypothetical protein